MIGLFPYLERCGPVGEGLVSLHNQSLMHIIHINATP